MLALHTSRLLRRRWPLLAAAVTVALLGGCGDLLGPRPPRGTLPLTPLPAEYDGWWALTQRCSGLEGDLRQIEWRVMPAGGTIGGRDNAVGSYYRRGHQIVLAEGKERDGWLVRHEMLHALLRGGGHPRDMFVERCAGIVSCSENCLREAGGPQVRDRNGPLVGASTLELGVEILPQSVSLTTGTRGSVTLVVSARNTRDVPVRLSLGRGGRGGFGFYVSGRLGSTFSGDTVLPFAAGEVRYHTFDVSGLGLPPGDHAVYGRFGNTYSEPAPMTLVP